MPSSSDSDVPVVAVHRLDAAGEMGELVATAQVAMPDVVVVRGVATLPLPAVVVASPEVLDPDLNPDADGRPAVFTVVAVHLPEDPGIDGAGEEDVEARSEHQLALEIAESRFILPASPDGETRMPARSFWCLLFPRLQACIQRS